jgi:uncharacterized protein (DUF488 family)
MSPSIFTIGHSNHPLERLLALLAQHGVEALADIRRFPGSRKHPHFHRDNPAAALPKSVVEVGVHGARVTGVKIRSKLHRSPLAARGIECRGREGRAALP